MKQFEKEAKLMTSALPLKTSIPKVNTMSSLSLSLSLSSPTLSPQEILKMELSEFISESSVILPTTSGLCVCLCVSERGGSFPTVWESLVSCPSHYQP